MQTPDYAPACRRDIARGRSLSARRRAAGPAGPYWLAALGLRGSCGNLHSRDLFERAHQRALAELDLESIVLARLGVGERGFGRRLNGVFAERVANEHFFRGERAPGLGRDAAERDARLPDAAVVEVERDRGGSKREFIGLPVADFQE